MREPLDQPAAQDHLDRAVADDGQATGRRRRTPHSRAPREPPGPATETRPTPTAAAGPGPPPDRVQLAHQCPQDCPEPSSDVDVVAIVGTIAPSTPPPRTAPAAAAPRPPRPLSPRGTRRRRPPRSRTARGRDRARASDVQASFRAAIAAPARPHLPFGSAGTFPAGDAPDRGRESLMHIFPVNDAAGSVLQPARRRRHVERIVQRVDQLRGRVAFGQLDQLPQGATTMKRSVMVSSSGVAAR